ncbi:MAG: formylglycine-generating enzyme family protein [Halieaceae bacterium]|nr:formylglycine-generating enzyme family protein [Halieaceae bacterium]
MLLVDLQSPQLFPYCRSQDDPESYFFSLQQQLLEEQEKDTESSDNDNQWEIDEGLQKLFRECLNPPIAKEADGNGQSLVRKFKFKHEVSTFLNFGYEQLQQEQTTKAAPDSTETEDIEPKAKRATKKKPPTKTAEKKADKNRKEAATAVPKAAADLQPVLREVRAMIRDGALSEAEGMLERLLAETREDSQRAEVAAQMAEIAILAGRPMAGAERYQSQTASMDKSVTAEHSEGLMERLGDLLADSNGFNAEKPLRDQAGRALAHLFATTCEGEMPDQSVFEKQPANETMAGLVNHAYGTPKMRAILGRAMAGLEDPRPGVGCKPDPKSKLLLPDFEWIKHPACRFHYQEAGEIDVAPFSLARYPVTHAQFQAFLDDPEGYNNTKWWTELAAEPEKPDEAAWPLPNHPRERVNWYEAMAFCAWASKRLGEEIRLPTEQEWERAARGDHGKAYPWGGDNYETGRANIDESDMEGGTYLERTSAVGLYQGDVTDPGVHDLSGNVWEWCLNEYMKPGQTGHGGTEARAVRGGSWVNYPDVARADDRDGIDPGYRDIDLGFRVLGASPSRTTAG